jgi:flagellar hook-length control protein FliK
MMRRLQFEEAQQSSYAITPARAGDEIRDESESESLAAEFQSLLAQITGQITAIPDQAIAMSYALAQTVVTERIKAVETAPIEQDKSSDDDQSGEIGGESRSATDGFMSDLVDRRSEMDDERDTAIVRDDKTAVTEEISIDTASPEIAPVLVDQLGQVVQQQVVQEVFEVVDNQQVTDLDTDHLALQQEVIERSDVEVVTEQATVNQVQVIDSPKNVLDDGGGKIAIAARHEAEKTVKEEETSEDLLASVLPTQTENSENTSEIRRNTGVSINSKQTEEERIATSQAQAQTTSEQPYDKSSYNSESGQQRSQNLEESVVVQRQKASDSNRKITAQDVELDVFKAQESSPTLDTRKGDMRPDSSIQMALLRQAFESLRVARSEGGDLSRQRQQAQVIQSAGAVTEAKSSQGEGASRAKSLTRPQIGRMLERVEATLKEAARGRDGKTISLHLEPVDLGKVKVDVSLREGTLHARISPDNQQVAQALREHSHELQGALRKLGLEVDSVTVSVTVDEFSGEMNTGQQMTDGRSFQDNRNNVPFERGQLADNTIGNELAVRSKAGADSDRLGAGIVTDHWIA